MTTTGPNNISGIRESNSSSSRDKSSSIQSDDKSNTNEGASYYIRSPWWSLEPHTDSVRDVKELKNGNIATCSYDRTLKLWSKETGECLFTHRHKKRIHRFLELSGDSGEFVYGDRNGYVHRFNLEAEAALQRIVSSSECHGAGMGSIIKLRDCTDGHFVVTGAGDCAVKIWDMKTLKCVQTLLEHGAPVNAVNEMSDGSLLSSSSDQTIKIWRRCLNQERKSITISLLSHPTTSNIKLFELEGTLYGHEADVNDARELRSGRIISCSDDHSIRLWDRRTRECLRVFGSANDSNITMPSVGHQDEVYLVEEVEDGIIVSCSWDQTIKVWKEATAECLFTFNAPTPLWRIIVLRDGSFLYGAGARRSLFISETWLR